MYNFTPLFSFPLKWYVAHFDYFQVYKLFCFFHLWYFCTWCCIAFSVSAVWNYSMLNTKLIPNLIYHLTALQPGKVHCLGVSNLWERICFDIGSPLFRVLLQMWHWNTKMYKKLVFGQMCHTERKGCRKVISWPKISPFLILFFRPSSLQCLVQSQPQTQQNSLNIHNEIFCCLVLFQLIWIT